MQSDICVLCQGAAETEMHIFPECPMAKSAWQQLKDVMGYRTADVSLENELNWLLNFNPVHRVLAHGVKRSFTAFIYWV